MQKGPPPGPLGLRAAAQALLLFSGSPWPPWWTHGPTSPFGGGGHLAGGGTSPGFPWDQGEVAVTGVVGASFPFLPAPQCWRLVSSCTCPIDCPDHGAHGCSWAAPQGPPLPSCCSLSSAASRLQ